MIAALFGSVRYANRPKWGTHAGKKSVKPVFSRETTASLEKWAGLRHEIMKQHRQYGRKRRGSCQNSLSTNKVPSSGHQCLTTTTTPIEEASEVMKIGGDFNGYSCRLLRVRTVTPQLTVTWQTFVCLLENEYREMHCQFIRNYLC